MEAKLRQGTGTLFFFVQLNIAARSRINLFTRCVLYLALVPCIVWTRHVAITNVDLYFHFCQSWKTALALHPQARSISRIAYAPPFFQHFLVERDSGVAVYEIERTNGFYRLSFIQIN